MRLSGNFLTLFSRKAEARRFLTVTWEGAGTQNRILAFLRQASTFKVGDRAATCGLFFDGRVPGFICTGGEEH